MYSAFQQQCLQQLGISLYQLKPDISQPKESLASSQKESWQQVPEQILSDLQILFPTMKVEGERLLLDDKSVWSTVSAQQVNITNNIIESPLPHLMSVEQKKQVWQQLAKFCSEHHG